MAGFLEGVAGFGGSVVDKLVDNAISYYTQKNQQAQAQANTQKNMRLQQQLEDQSWFNRIALSTTALKAAGLSPALATGQAQGSAAVSHNEGMPQVGMPHPYELDRANNMALANSQRELNEAAAEKAKAEAQATEIKNKREEHLDSTLSDTMHQMVSEMRETTDNPFMRAFLDTYLESTSDKFNLGDYEAFNKLWFDMTQRERDRELDYIQKEFDKRVLQLQYENGAAAVIADMPRVKRYEVYAAINQMNANVARLNAETSLTEDQRDKLRAETSKLGQEVMSIFHSDPAAMYKAGDIMSLLVGLGYDGIKAASAGAGFALGTAAVRGTNVPGTIAAAPNVAKAASKAGSVPSKVLSQIRANAAKVANGNKVYEAQLFNAAVAKWKKQNLK